MLILAGTAQTAFAGVVLELRDGSRISGDRLESNDEHREMELRIERRGIEITRRLKVADVKSATIDGQPFHVGSNPRSIEPAAPVGETIVPETTLAANAILCETDACPFDGVPGTVIGVRDDPLGAYQDSVVRAFPFGVPQLETEFALELMRAARARNVLEPAGEIDVPSPTEPAPPTRSEPQSFFVPRRSLVRSIAAAVRPVNANGRVDWNAIEVEVRALDLEGHIVPANGTLQATLWGRREKLVRSIGTVLAAEPGDVLKLGEWTRNLDPHTATTVAADGKIAAASRFLLELSDISPDLHFDLAPLADLHIRFAVPGQGVFETTVDGINLRRRSPVRDQRLIESGSPFLPGEGTSLRTQPAGSWRFTRPTSGPDRRVLSVEP